MKVLSVVDDLNRAHELEMALKHWGWDYEIIRADWRGFGTKPNKIKEYLNEHEDVKEFIFLDGYDTFVLGPPSEFNYNGLDLIAAEVNCWPDIDRASEYKQSGYRLNYLNSGSYYMNSARFIAFINDHPISNDSDDQRWLTDIHLRSGLEIDYSCKFFQTLCGFRMDEFKFECGRLINEYGNKPIFIHGNGKGDMTEIYKLIP